VRTRIAIYAGAIVAAIGVWTVLASNLFVWMGRLSAYFPMPLVTWWSYATQPRIAGTTLFYLIASAIVAAVPLVLIGIAIVLVLRRGRHRRLVPPPGGGLRPLESGVTDNHGHSAFATDVQTAKRYAGPGCLIGAADRGERARLLFDNVAAGPTHSLIFAGPGSHKTTSAITRLWNWNGPRVVFDPSCEIGPIMTKALEETDHRVISIGTGSGGFNVLDWLDPAHDECDAHIKTVVDHIWSSAGGAKSHGMGGADPFWETQGKALVTCLLAHMVYAPARVKTLASLRQAIATPESDMPTLLAGIHASSASQMARQIAGSLRSMRAKETFSGIVSNANAGTEWLSVGAYSSMVSGNVMLSRDILDPKTVVFVQIPLRTLMATPAIGRAVVGSLFNALFTADGNVQSRVLFQLDEAKQLGAMKEISTAFATARKYRGTVSMLYQSEAQLDEVWGREGARAMRDSASWRSYNGIQDGDVAEKLSRDIGEHGVLAYSEGDNRGRSKPFGLAPGSRSSGRNTNVHEIKRRLVKADEIMRAPADEMFVLARDFPHPIRCVSAPYFRYPEIASQMQANRFVTA
jgi:type IV secretion system protein VirD4